MEGRTWNDWEVNVIGMHDVKFLKNQEKHYVGKKIFRTCI